ncbi:MULTISPECIES: IniB N-terminal domain-containing protein [unclassified Microbacterium]|uniref:IniB N-terminal domain-containing protein n=1 Tax=unclassified Microbacterium TaxID=2609290 RepID=UPI0037460281
MSVTLATMADALIEFILSLLRDPTAAAEFEEDPQGAMAARGLNNVSAADVCAVAPVIAERAAVSPAAVLPSTARQSVQPDPDVDPVVREVNNITSNFQWVDDRDTIVDQSVNQNIWADGDVTQVFDQDSVVASGDDSMAAGDDASVEQTEDNSTNIGAGDDVNLGNDTDVTVIDDSMNEDTDTSTTTDSSTEVVVDESLNDDSTTVASTDSFNSSDAVYTDTTVSSDSDAVFGSEDAAIVDDTTDGDTF